MDTTAITQKIYEYVKDAGDEKLKVLYAYITEEAGVAAEWWKNGKLVAELEKRFADLKSGKDNAVFWNEAKETITRNL